METKRLVIRRFCAGDLEDHTYIYALLSEDRQK